MARNIDQRIADQQKGYRMAEAELRRLRREGYTGKLIIVFEAGIITAVEKAKE